MMARVVASHSGDLTELEARQDPRLLRALDMVAPGTPLRDGIDNIIYARTGGLILIADADEVSFLFSGGIKLDVDYTPALLYQVAKMDGAIVLDPGTRRICWANVQLMPDPTILSMETGTRHRTAERVSKQTRAVVIAISQRRDVVSLYVEGIKYILEDIPIVLSKANQGLATLEKYRDRLDQVSARLTDHEFSGTAVLYDALSVVQRAELVTRMAAEVERYIIELGTEGRLIEMQLEETVVGVMADRAATVRDYSVVDTEQALEHTLSALSALDHHEILDFGRLAELLGYDRKTNTLDFAVAPRGYRALSRVPHLPRLVAQKVVHHCGDLAAILAASEDELEAVEGVGDAHAKEIREGLRRLQEIDPVDRYR
jgi:diadenylate cyclase